MFEEFSVNPKCDRSRRETLLWATGNWRRKVLGTKSILHLQFDTIRKLTLAGAECRLGVLPLKERLFVKSQSLERRTITFTTIAA